MNFKLRKLRFNFEVITNGIYDLLADNFSSLITLLVRFTSREGELKFERESVDIEYPFTIVF